MDKKLLASLMLGSMGCMYAYGLDGAENWMSRLDDRAYIHQVSIPGTHDAGTGNGTTLDSFARTQDLTMAEQFDAGVRAFDLRPSVKDGALQIYHGIISTKVSLDQALTTLCERLDANPTEFAVVIMRHEDDHESDAEKQQWNDLVVQTLQNEKYAGRFTDFYQMLSVGDVRGKILILSRDRYADVPIGGFISNWTHSASLSDQSKATISGADASRPSARLYVQDFYEIKDNMDTKLSAVKTLLDLSTTFNTTTPHAWVINHTSGYCKTGLLATRDSYRTNAVSTNQAVIDYLSDETHAGPAGMVMMDFAGVDKSGDYEVNGKKLVEAVVENNFRYTMRGTSSGVEAIAVAPSSSVSISADGVVSAEGPIFVYGISGATVAKGVGNVKVSQPGVYMVKTAAGVRKMIVR